LADFFEDREMALKAAGDALVSLIRLMIAPG